MTGCTRSTSEIPYPSYGPDPRIVAETRALETDWDRIARRADAIYRIPARAAAGDETVRTAPAPAPQRVASSSIGDAAAGTPPRRNLWDRQPWEVDLDRTVRGICRGC
jgi:hypothetical protein